ncbi:thiamine-phosphate pyrophosphorylase [Roseovarius marisflavi]|uniref:Thiamine-phosphate pyrophosphorylase n=1 Tax=Roseovarius marisflavi TaxID=1054996 RepID=A0A1M6ZXK5_9RHOB|nr:thiamine phosphate synthase [Roseovarius marisflavi]SHL35150.1 thiamine-phosphate pyrophosphorylase [Roseovarius marisflavi]
MAETEQPQIYLITPPEFELSRFPETLARVLDSQDVACVRLALASRDEDRIARAADACREVTHERDIALVIDTHVLMVERLGLDGVHLLDGARTVRFARKELGDDAIIGSFCGTSRHVGISAGEAGADYISFGPVGASALGDGSQVEEELFDWWSKMIELPVVAEGALDAALVAQLAPMTDFFAFGDEIWQQDDPVAALAALVAAMG